MTRSRTILFVDDEEKIRKYFRRLFGRQYDVIVAADAEEGLRTLAERRDEIGLVVSDHMMPRMTGLEFLEEIEKNAPEVIRAMSTAYADSELVAKAIQNGLIEYFIRKPWELDVVTATLEEAAAQFDQRQGIDAGVSREVDRADAKQQALL